MQCIMRALYKVIMHGCCFQDGERLLLRHSRRLCQSKCHQWPAVTANSKDDEQISVKTYIAKDVVNELQSAEVLHLLVEPTKL